MTEFNRRLAVYSIALFVVSACFDSSVERQTGGHTNWLKCKSFKECEKSSQAVACSDGYCVDDAGDRIMAEEDDLSTGSVQIENAGGDTDDGDLKITKQTEIDILPHFGGYTICGVQESSGLIIREAHVESAYSEKKWNNMYDKEQPSDINPGDPILIVTGEIENESGDGPYVNIWAEGYDSQGNQVAWTLDSGSILGEISIYIEQNESSEFELHLTFSENIAGVQIHSCAYTTEPP